MSQRYGPFMLFMLVLLSSCTPEPKPSAQAAAKGAFDELRMAILAEIPDTHRANSVAVLVDQLEHIMAEAAEVRKVHNAKIRALNTDYDAKEDDFRAVFKEFNAKRDARQERILAIDQRARTLTTAQEWKAVSKDVARALAESARAELTASGL